MTHPTVTESIRIGRIHGEPAHAWTESTDAGPRYFKDTPAEVFAPSLGRDVGLSNVVEIEAAEYHTLFSVFAAWSLS